MVENPLRRVGNQVVDLFGHPGGRAARPMAHVLNFFNHRTGERAAPALGVRPGHRVLEVGFGGGAAIPSTLRALDGAGVLCAVDLSQDMVGVAARRFSAAVGDGRLVLVNADALALPLNSGTFDRAYALHSHMYWPSVLAGIREFHRVLVPGGQLLLAMDTVAGIPLLQRFGGSYRPAESGQLGSLFAEAGFADITTQKLTRGVVSLSGTRP